MPYTSTYTTNTPTPQPLRAWLAAHRRTNTWLAECSGYSAMYIGAVACRRLPASPSFRARIAEALGVDESLLFDDDPATTKPAQ